MSSQQSTYSHFHPSSGEIPPHGYSHHSPYEAGSATLLQQQHRDNQYAATQGGHMQAGYGNRSGLEFGSRAGDDGMDINEESLGEGDVDGNGDFSQTFYDPFKIKHRRRTSAAQLKILEYHFEHNPKPDVILRKALSEQLDMTPREVQVWFQNRRAKTKKIREKVGKGLGVEGQSNRSPEGSQCHLPSPPLTHDPNLDHSTFANVQRGDPSSGSVSYEGRNVYDVAGTGYPGLNRSPFNSTHSYTQAQGFNYPGHSFNPLPHTPAERSSGVFYQLPAARSLPSEFEVPRSKPTSGSRSYSPPNANWVQGKDYDGSSRANISAHHYPHSFASSTSSPPLDVQAILADLELLSPNGDGRSPDFGFSRPREDGGDEYSPSSSNEEQAPPHEFTGNPNSATGSGAFEQAPSLSQYSFGTGSPQLSQGAQAFLDHGSLHSGTGFQGYEDSSTLARRSSCPAGPLSDFDTLGLTPSSTFAPQPWAISGLSLPINNNGSPSIPDSVLQKRHSIAASPMNGSFHTSSPQTSSSLLSYGLPTTFSTGTGATPSSYSYSNAQHLQSSLARRGSTSSSLGTIPEQPLLNRGSVPSYGLNEQMHKSLDAEVHSFAPRKVRSQNNLKFPYSPHDQISPELLEHGRRGSVPSIETAHF